MLWLALVLLLGPGSTVLLFRYLAQVDQERLHLHLQRSAETVASFITQPFVEQLLLELQDKLGAVQGELYEGTAVSQQLLDLHLWQNPPRGLGTTSLEYLPRLDRDGGAMFPAALSETQNSRLAVLLASLENSGQATADGSRFPVLLEAGPGLPRTVPGFERSREALHLLALQQARDSAQFTFFADIPLVDSGAQEQLSYFFVPLYSGGGIPAGLQERREQLSAFIAAVSYNPVSLIYTLLSPGLQGIRLVSFPEPRAVDADPEYAELRYLLASQQAALSTYEANGQRRSVVVTASPALKAVITSSMRWWVLAIGLLLSAGAGALLLWIRNQSRQIFALVDARTAELRESEARYRMLAEHASDVIFATDLEGNLSYVSPSVQAQRGFSVDELMGRHLSTQLPSGLASSLMERLVQLRKQGEPAVAGDNAGFEDTFEYESQCRDGSGLWLETTLSTLYGADGQPAGLLGVSRDISERRQVESERSRLEEAYRQAQKMEAIGTLAGGIAHDFNNLLTAIFGYADMLRYQVHDNPQAEESIGVIEKAATRARDLTSQLLGFARKGRYQAVPVDLNDSIQEVFALLRRSLDRNIEIKLQPASAPATITGDPGQLTHMLLNLGINARDAMPDGGRLTFSVQRMALDERFCEKHPELQPGRYVLLSVSDTGTGIAKEQQTRIFEPFYTNKRQGKGTGLGLAMVYGVARSHGGLVTVESELGEGAVFRVYLPYVAAETGMAESKPEPLPGPASGSGTILVVDDESDIRTLAARMLDLLGYRVLLAENGREALEIYRQQHADIDLVIVDMIMPVMGGRECIEALKSVNSAVRIIVASGYSMAEAGAAVPLDSIFGFLQKPWRQHQLAQMLAEALAGRPAR